MSDQFDREPPSSSAEPFGQLADLFPQLLTRRAVALARRPWMGVRSADADDVVSDAVLSLLVEWEGWDGILNKVLSSLDGATRPTERELEDAVMALLGPRIRQIAQNYRRRKENRAVTLSADLSQPLEEIADSRDAYKLVDRDIEQDQLFSTLTRSAGGRLLVAFATSHLTHAEFAAKQGISVELLSSRLDQARKRVRKGFGRDALTETRTLVQVR